jgi:hypothetical protein
VDSGLLGSIIEASATLLAIVFAVWVARRELRLTREQMRLATYENFLNGERQLIGIQLQDPENTRALLAHFKMKDIPETASDRLTLLGAFMQIQIYESIYYRHRKGFFPGELWEQWDRSMANSFITDTFRTVWEQTDAKEFLWPEFVRHIDGAYFFKRI